MTPEIEDKLSEIVAIVTPHIEIGEPEELKTELRELIDSHLEQLDAFSFGASFGTLVKHYVVGMQKLLDILPTLIPPFRDMCNLMAGATYKDDLKMLH